MPKTKKTITKPTKPGAKKTREQAEADFRRRHPDLPPQAFGPPPNPTAFPPGVVAAVNRGGLRPTPVTAEEVLSAATANAQEATKRMATTEVEVKKIAARLEVAENAAALAHRSAIYAQEQLTHYKRYCIEGRARHLLEVVGIVHRSVKANADRLRCETVAMFSPTPPVRPPSAAWQAVAPISDTTKVALGATLIGGIGALLYSGLLGGTLYGAAKRGAVKS